jgi:tetratricopeptide (TPR) repeat protein
VNESRRQLNAAAARLAAADASGCLLICNHMLLAQPGLLEAVHLRGISHAQLGNTDQAIADLSQLWSVQKNNAHAALLLGSQLRLAGRFDEAVAPLSAARSQPKFEIDARYELARVLTRLRRTGEAVNEYKAVLSRNPQHADAAANLSFLLERANQLDQAMEYAEQALATKPDNFMANLSKATVDRRRGNVEEAVCCFRTLLQEELSALNRSIVLNQLGQCFDKLSAWGEAFDCFRESNTILRNHHPHGRAVDSGSYGMDTVRHIQQWLKSNPPANWSANSLAAPADPVFLVGFPRSGTTLLDQALSAHADIEVMEEVEFFDAARRDWVDQGHLDKIPEMSEGDIVLARDSYLQALNKSRQHSNRAVVVDKLPLNLAYLFLIHRLFPRSRILFVLRDPRDACLSSFFQAFDLQGAMPYFLDLNDTVSYYGLLMSLVTESNRAISNPMMTVRYEELVTEFEPTMRRLIEFLGMKWDAEILNFQQKAQHRAISTPSYQQVIQPLYTESIGRWRNYRQFVQSEFRALDQWVRHFEYAMDDDGL